MTEPQSAELPRVVQLDTLHGWRRAYLFYLENRIGLYSLNFRDVRLGPESDAKCLISTYRSTYRYVTRLNSVTISASSSASIPVGSILEQEVVPEELRHEAPALDCACGFYALKDLAELNFRAPSLGGNVVLEVELSGRIIEATNGFRAQHQRILGCHLGQGCQLSLSCNLPAVGMGRSAGEGNVARTCGTHGEAFLTPADLSNELGVEVQMGIPS